MHSSAADGTDSVNLQILLYAVGVKAWVGSYATIVSDQYLLLLKCECMLI